MLSRSTAPEAAKAAVPLRICTICDGVDAVIRLASWLSHLPNAGERVDLELAEALDHLDTDLADHFDLIVISMTSEREVTTPRLVQTLLDATQARASVQVVLVQQGTRLRLREGSHARIIEGPPFQPFSGLADLMAPSSAPEVSAKASAPRSAFARLLGLARAAPPAAEPAAPPLRVLACLPAAGGAGASTLAVNLARQLSAGHPALEVIILDLDLQFGAVASYFDLPPQERVLDAYRNLAALDAEGFEHCLHEVAKGLHVFAAPDEIVPLDAIDRNGLTRLVEFAMRRADLVIMDLPPMVAEWSGTAFGLADRILLVSELEVRSARAIARLRSLAGPEHLSPERLIPVITHAPKKPTADWGQRLAKFEQGLGLRIASRIPFGGEALAAACDSGTPPETLEPKSAFLEALIPLAERLRQAAVPGIATRRRE